MAGTTGKGGAAARAVGGQAAGDARRAPTQAPADPGRAPPGARPQGGAFVNAKVLPMGFPASGVPGWERTAQAILWVGDRVVAVGPDEAVRREAARHGIAPEDLGGRVVLPGFVDAHTHFLHVGVKRTRPDLRGARDLGEALGRLRAFLAAHPGAHHVIGEGWDESEWGPGARRPTKEDLDTVVADAARDGHGPPDRPVVLRRICGHIAVASSGALPRIRAHWDDDAAVDLASGLLLEAPSLYLNEVLASTPTELDRAVEAACAEAHRLGVTAVGDYSQAPYRAALQRAAARGRLTVRTASSVYVQQLGDEEAAGFRTGRPGLAPQDVADGWPGRTPSHRHDGAVPGRDGGDRLAGGASDWLRDGGLKVFLDGSLGGHTAYLRDPYLDLADEGPAADPNAPGGPAQGGGSGQASPEDHAGHDHPAGAVGPRGSRIWDDAQLDRLFGTAHAAGIQVHAHAIGDAAIDQGLDAFARLAARASLEGQGWPVEPMPRLAASPIPEEAAGGGGEASGSAPGPRGLRHRFEHYEIVHDDQVARTVELGIVASSQPNFVGEWSAKGGMYEARLGDRYLLNNRFRAFLDAGVPLAFGSDGMPFGPLVGLAAAVGHPDPAQRMSPRQAVWHYTTAAAWALHWEDRIGRLDPGCAADLVVLEDRDLDGPPGTWRIRQTIAGGVRQWPLPDAKGKATLS